MHEETIRPLRDAVIAAFPELAGSSFRYLAEGWDSVALETDGQVFKFPKHDVAERALIREAALLAIIRPRVALPVPAMRIHRGATLFSSHEMLGGSHLLAEHYRSLPEPLRDRLGRDLGRFYAQLHALPRDDMAAAGAAPVETWQAPDAVLDRAVPALPESLRERARGTVEAFRHLPQDPYGTTYGFFDGHGWNMAFDHARGRLNGIYDFADSGFGPLHQDFIYSNFIDPDLTERTVAAYEAETGRTLDRRRITVLTGYHRLSELSALAHEPQHLADMVRHVVEWFDVAPPVA